MKSISCKEAVNYILRKEERKLSFLQKLSLWRHLAICSLCRIFALQNDLINQAMKRRQEKVQPLTNEEKEEIIQNVLSEKE